MPAGGGLNGTHGKRTQELWRGPTADEARNGDEILFGAARFACRLETKRVKVDVVPCSSGRLSVEVPPYRHPGRAVADRNWQQALFKLRDEASILLH